VVQAEKSPGLLLHRNGLMEENDHSDQKGAFRCAWRDGVRLATEKEAAAAKGEEIEGSRKKERPVSLSGGEGPRRGRDSCGPDYKEVPMPRKELDDKGKTVYCRPAKRRPVATPMKSRPCDPTDQLGKFSCPQTKWRKAGHNSARRGEIMMILLHQQEKKK